MKNTQQKHYLTASLAVAALTCFSTAQAATKTWNGANANNPAWYANTNWTPGVAPVDGDDLVFAGTTRYSPTALAQIRMVIMILELLTITFDNTAGAFVINNGGGGTIKIAGRHHQQLHQPADA